MSTISEVDIRDWDRTLVHKEQSAFDTQVGGSHYKQFAIQPTEYIFKNNLGFAEGNIIKYVSRWKNKSGVEDLMKAQHYLAMLIEMATSAMPPVAPTKGT